VGLTKRFVGVALVAATVALCTPATAHADRTITLTFVRHAQSAANAAAIIDTSLPGPGLSAQGYEQADKLAKTLSGNGYDGIYASTMIRTQETAAPLSKSLHEPVTVLPGLREIDAGIYEGQPMANVNQLLDAPMAWLRGDRTARIPGSIDGNEFDAQFDEAVQAIYDSGNLKPVVFSHLLTIMLGVLMNVSNPDMSLFDDPSLPNSGRIVIVGSPQQGWMLTDWNGTPVPR
jgi:broad specificity phosphatase PhoE